MNIYKAKSISDEKVWNDFVTACAPSSFLHTWQWGAFEERFGRQIYRLGVFETMSGKENSGEEKLRAVLLAVKTKARRGTFLICPHGPVILGAFEEVFPFIAKELVEIGKKERCDFVRISPCTIETAENAAVFAKEGFIEAPIHVYSELSWILDITPSEDVLQKNMKKNTRYGIRKAERDGVTIVSSANPEDISKFWDIYERTATYQDFVPYSKKFIEREFAEFSKVDGARWYFAYYKNEIVSAAVIVFTPWSAFYHHGASLHTHSSITPSEALQWQVICDAKKRGCKRYNFWGVVQDEEIHHPWAGLSAFKKGFGGYAEKYIHAKDYPITWKYWFSYAIEKIRKWKRNV